MGLFALTFLLQNVKIDQEISLFRKLSTTVKKFLNNVEHVHIVCVGAEITIYILHRLHTK